LNYISFAKGYWFGRPAIGKSFAIGEGEFKYRMYQMSAAVGLEQLKK